jgi:hypothetical protein
MAKRAGIPRKIRDAAAARGCEVIQQSNGDALLIDGCSRTLLTQGSINGIAAIVANDQHPFWTGDTEGALEPRDGWRRLDDWD